MTPRHNGATHDNYGLKKNRKVVVHSPGIS
jgi:hypothetical protein